jgi:glucose uptake protein GlcU
MYPSYVGFICCAISVLGFGTYIVPLTQVKRRTKDQSMILFVQATAIMCLGLAVQPFSQSSLVISPKHVNGTMEEMVGVGGGEGSGASQLHFLFLHLPTLAGGALWAIGNLTAMPIADILGVGVGATTWSLVSLVAGWIIGSEGWLGVSSERVAVPALNVIGVVLAALSIPLYSRVRVTRPEDKKNVRLDTEAGDVDSLSEPLLINTAETAGRSSGAPPLWLRAFALLLATFAGCCYAINLIPVSAALETPELAHTNPMAFAFSHFFGIWLTSLAVLLGTLIFTKNRPELPANFVACALTSGLLWAMAQCSWFVANASLPLITTYPIICSGPGLVANLWSIFYLKEVTGRRNYIALVLAGSTSLAGIISIAISYKGV